MYYFLDEVVLNKYPCTDEMIIDALATKGVRGTSIAVGDSYSPESCLNPAGTLVQVPVKDYVVVLDEEMFAIHLPTGEKIYYPGV